MERSSPTSLFSSVDLPTLGLPMMATSMTSGCFFFLDRGHDADLRERGIEEIVHPSAVLGSDGEDRHAKAMENIGVGFLRHGVDFVDGDDKRFASGAQEPRQFFVERREARLAIDDQNE